MKTKGTYFKLLILSLLFAITGRVGNAQTFNCYVANDHLASPTVYEFDIYVEPTSTDFYMRSIQMGFLFNSAFIPAGATITPAYDNTFSQTVSPFNSGPPQWNATHNALSVPSSAVQGCFGAPSTASGHTLFSTTTGAKRIVRLRLTSTIPFECASPQITMIRPLDPVPQLGITKMALSQWGPTCTAITLNNNGTYTHFATNTLYSLVNNLNDLTVSATSPATSQLCAGTGSATFSVTATGNGTSTALSYQWTLDGVPLVDNGTYSGSNTATLVITNPTVGGLIACQVSQCSPTSFVTSADATLTVVTSDDGNACTIDACDPATGTVTHTPVSVDDADACTTDGCDPISGIFHTPVNTDDGDACTVDGCDPATGVTHTPVNTDDGDACTVDGCDPATGVTHTPVNVDDNNVCTTDACDPSTGVSHTPINIDDNNVCTADACDPVTGPSHTPISVDDNNVCTTDACDPITGVSHTPINIDDQDACTTDACDPISGPSHTPINVDDNNACTIDICDPATGAVHTPIDPDDNNACTNDACDPLSGVSNTPVNVDDGNACTTDGCDPLTGISHIPVNTDDGNACTTDGCDPATGVSHTPVNVNDGNACTTDACDPVTGISHTPVNVDDNNVCTTDACDPSTGVSHTPVNIDDGNACTTDACDPVTGPSHTPVNIDDNNVCTTDACDPATGVSHTPVNIDDGDACTTDACDPVTGVSHTQINVDDNNACTTDACDPVTGVSHTPVNSDDGNACTVDACDPITGVSHTPVNIDDNNACTADGCDPVTGIFHNPIIISDDNLCTTDACDPITGISHTPVNIDDGNLCTTDACDPITGISHTPVNVDDQDICTIDACDPLTGITHTPVVNAVATSTPAGCNTGGTASAEPIGTQYSYLWSPGGETTQTITNVPAGPYSVWVTDISTGCSASASTTVGSNGGGSSAPPGPISGPIYVCKGQHNVVYCVDPIPGVNSYQWTLPNGVTGYSTGPCITVNITSRFRGGQICVSTVSACGNSLPSCITIIKVSSKPHTPGNITGPSILCPGTSSDYSIAPVANATSYEWVVSGGLIINSGQGTTTINVTAPAGFVSGYVKVRAINCKGKSGYRKLNISGVSPILRWDFKDPDDNPTSGVCAGSTYHYDTHFDGITCRIWTAPPGAIIYNYATNTSGNPLTVNSSSDGVHITFPTPFTSGQVTVASCNGCGASTPITLNVTSSPLSPPSISGPTSGTCHSTNYYTISSVPGATSYSWTVPNNVSITGILDGGKKLRVYVHSAFVSGDICVIANNSCGSSAPTCITVISAPAAPGNISGPSTVCKSASNVQYSVSSISGASSYTWSVNNGVQIRSGQGSRKVKLRFTSANSSTATVSVFATNNCGQSTTTTRVININLNCKVADGEEIIADEIGSLNAYPNPTSGNATITFNASNDAKYILSIVDVLGKTMISEIISASEGINIKEINLKGVSSGMYFINLQTEGEKSETLRLIVK